MNEDLPAIIGHLQLVEIESGEVVHVVILNLTTKNEDLGANNIEGMTVSASWARTSRQCS
jgi:hypothetical protein